MRGRGEERVSWTSIPSSVRACCFLSADPGSPYQYHCLHNTGVHSVSLPWAKKLQSYCLQGDS